MSPMISGARWASMILVGSAALEAIRALTAGSTGWASVLRSLAALSRENQEVLEGMETGLSTFFCPHPATTKRADNKKSFQQFTLYFAFTQNVPDVKHTESNE